jgi:hypothetical protein
MGTMSIKIAVVDEYLQKNWKNAERCRGKLGTIAKSRPCSGRETKEIGEIPRRLPEKPKKIIAIQRKSGYNKLIHYPYQECGRRTLLLSE